ncbi:hypothetical protein EI94DRAFT_1740984 [Lactarius quietus]|nr:hypothetical protein EI94DRAFT_1740984 [Lactarius quietus]
MTPKQCFSLSIYRWHEPRRADRPRAKRSHILVLLVIVTVYIFQYSNMYTLHKSVQWLAGEAHVKEDCGPYVIKDGRAIPGWPKLLHLYSRMRPGTTVFEWMQDHDVRSIGIDVRRFATFGVIKARTIHPPPCVRISHSTCRVSYAACTAAQSSSPTMLSPPKPK